MDNIEKFDFVTVAGDDKFLFVYDVTEGLATLVGMRLTEKRDDIYFYSIKVKVESLQYVSDYFVNLYGPLAKLRDNIKAGEDNQYIEGIG